MSMQLLLNGRFRCMFSDMLYVMKVNGGIHIHGREETLSIMMLLLCQLGPSLKTKQNKKEKLATRGAKSLP